MHRKRKRFRHVRRHQHWERNCERVFTVLTGGPFPTGSPEDDLIEAHLSFCPECRRLAESLRPTGNMLAAANSRGTGPDDSPGMSTGSGLPGYWAAAARTFSPENIRAAARGRRADVEPAALRPRAWTGAAIAVVLALVALAIACYEISP